MLKRYYGKFDKKRTDNYRSLRMQQRSAKTKICMICWDYHANFYVFQRELEAERAEEAHKLAEIYESNLRNVGAAHNTATQIESVCNFKLVSF